MKSRIIQYFIIILILSAITGGYFYFQSTAAQKINSSKVSNLTSGLVGYWTFDGADTSTTTAIDKSTAGKDGTLSGATKPTPAVGKIGQALNFNGSTSYIDVTNITSAIDPPFSLGAWIKLNSIPSANKVIAAKSGSLAMRATATTIECVDSNTGRGPVMAISWTVGQWYHVTCVISASDMTGAGQSIYVNGSNSGSVSDGWYGVDGGTSLKIGSNGSGAFFDGQIDEVRYYNRALTQSEITELYQQGQAKINASQAGKLENGLIGYWTFDGADTNSTTVTDKSSSGRNGTLAGSTKPAPVIGKIGQGLNFNGTTSYVNVAGFTQWYQLPLSYGAWVKLNATPAGDRYVIYKSGEFYLRIGATSVACKEDNSGQGETVKTITLVPGEWYHIFCSISSGSKKIYINGVDSSATVGGFAPSPYGETLKIGGEPDYGSGLLDGQMDEVRIYNRALSQSEITELYQQGQTKINASQTNKLTSGLVGYYTFDGPDMTATTALDKSPGEINTGTLTATTRTIGKIGQALNFSTGGASVHRTDSGTIPLDLTGSMTFSAWVNLNDLTKASGVIVGKGSNYRLQLDNNNNCAGAPINNQYEIYLRFPVDACSNNDVITQANRWYHVAVTFDKDASPDYAQFYVDGSPAGSMAYDVTPTVNESNFVIGNFAAGQAATEFPGSIDEVRIYSRALSQSEVTELYNMGR